MNHNFLHHSAFIFLVFLFSWNIGLSQTEKTISIAKSDAYTYYSSHLNDTISISCKDTVEDPSVGYTISIDNEAFLKKSLNEDRNYTQGVEFKASGLKTNANWYLLPLIHKSLDKIPYLCKGDKQSRNTLVYHHFTFGFSAFTPLDIDLVDPIVDDRPYAALIYLKTTRDYLSKNEKWLFKTEFGLGLLGGFAGSQLAKGFQTASHAWLLATSSEPEKERPLPLGWHNQLSNESGALMLQYNFRAYNNAFIFKEEELKIGSSDDFKIQLRPYYGFGLGRLYTFAEAGASMKIGWFKDFFDTPTNVSYNKIRQASFVALPEISPENYNPKKSWGLYFFSTVNANIWGYNSTLQGALLNRKGNHYLESDQVLPNAFLQCGLGGYYGKFGLELSLNRRTQETTLVNRQHLWGRVSLIFLP